MPVRGAVGTRVRVAALLTVVVLVGWLDYISGPDIGFSLFYLLPVVLAGWLDGQWPGVLVAVAGSTAWLTADYLWHPTAAGVSAWNGFTRLIIFISLGILMARLRRERERLQEANQELESFTYSVSHDLRSPLLHIGSFADKLSRRASASLDSESLRYLGTITDSASMALTLIDDLLDFARLARVDLKRAAVDLDALVRDVRQELTAVDPQRNVTWAVAPLPTVQGDGPMLRVVIHNLLENAWKYTRRREDALIAVGCSLDEGEIVFSVRDNGAGFDQQYSGKLFRVFERLHSAKDFEGRGIGLAIVARIISRHGGRTWAEGAVGSGATFYFSLPVSS